MMTPEEERERLNNWKSTLWDVWEEGRRLGRHPVSLATMKAAFYSAFDAGRDSIRIISKAKRTKNAERKV
jgi:hypothetical protein